MKISDFNRQAPKLVNSFKKILDKLVNGEVKPEEVAKLKANVAKAIELNSLIHNKLTGVNKETLVAIRSNAASVGTYTTAVDNSASLSNILPVISNLLNELGEEEDEDTSLDELLGGDGSDEPEQNMDGGEEGDEANCGTSNAEGGEEDDQEADEDAEDDMDDEIENMLNSFPKTAPVTKPKSNKNSQSSGLVPNDFLA